jgi:uncharacterized protein YaaQ
MRLVISVVQDQDVNRLLSALMEHGYSATKLASTGGFLKQGNTTLLVGVEDNQVSEVTEIIKETCHSRKQLIAPMAPIGRTVNSYTPNPVEVTVGGAAIFVLNVEDFSKV